MIQNLISISPFFNCCLFPQHDKSPRNPPTSVRVLQSRSSKLAWGLKLLFLLMVHHGKNFNDFVPNILGIPRAQAVSSIDSSPPPLFFPPIKLPTYNEPQRQHLGRLVLQSIPRCQCKSNVSCTHVEDSLSVDLQIFFICQCFQCLLFSFLELPTVLNILYPHIFHIHSQDCGYHCIFSTIFQRKKHNFFYTVSQC